MKTKPNVFLCVLMSLVIVAFTFSGYLFADNYNLREADKFDTIEIPTKEYEAISKVVVYGPDEEINDNKFSAGVVPDDSFLAETWSKIFRYSEGMREVIPEGYSVSVEPINETNILSIVVIGTDPDKCVQTANELAVRAPKIYKTFYANGECRIVDYATEGTLVVNTFETPKKELSAVFFAAIGFGVGALLYIIMICVDISYRKKRCIPFCIPTDQQIDYQ